MTQLLDPSSLFFLIQSFFNGTLGDAGFFSDLPRSQRFVQETTEFVDQVGSIQGLARSPLSVQIQHSLFVDPGLELPADHGLLPGGQRR